MWISTRTSREDGLVAEEPSASERRPGRRWPLALAESFLCRGAEAAVTQPMDPWPLILIAGTFGHTQDAGEQHFALSNAARGGSNQESTT